jgi:ABC-type multidrug transport system fused ATPase/permease subunit
MIAAPGEPGRKLSIRGDLRLLYRLYREYGRSKRAAALYVALSATVPAFTLTYPVVAGRVIDAITNNADYSVIRNLALIVLGVALGQAAIKVVITIVNNQISAQVCRQLTIDFYGQQIQQSTAFFNWLRAGVVTSRGSNDLRQVEYFMYNLSSDIILNSFTLLYSVILVFTINPAVGLGGLALIPLFFIPARLISKRVRTQTSELMDLRQDLNHEMAEKLTSSGSALVRLYGSANREIAKFSAIATKLRVVQSALSVKQQAFVQSMIFITSAATALVYLIGGAFAVRGELSPGEIVTVTAVLAGLYPPIMSLSTNTIEVSRVAACLQRIFALLDVPNLVTERDIKVDVPDGPLSLEFRDVSFRYPAPSDLGLDRAIGAASDAQPSLDHRFVVADLSFEVRPGTTVAIVGSSGAGKSTIAQLAARLYDPSRGVVSLGGVSLADLGLQELRNCLGYVLQDGYLFHESIRDNLLLAAPNASESDLRAALDAARLSTLIGSLPAGLDTIVGDRGYRFSGGERQRLAIARLFLKNPRVVILDEATASLDNESEVEVQKALESAMAGRTCLVIAHRLSTVRNADEILVMSGGRILERGTHESLRRAGNHYERLYLAGELQSEAG